MRKPSTSDLEALLETLCVRLGICFTGDHYERLVDNPPADPITYADAVISSYGMDPRTIQGDLYSQVLAEVERTFEAAGT